MAIKDNKQDDTKGGGQIRGLPIRALPVLPGQEIWEGLVQNYENTIGKTI